MKIRGYNYRGKEQGVTHNQPTGESTHTSRKEHDSLFSWISKSLQRVGKEILTKETLTLVRKDTNTNSFLHKTFLGKNIFGVICFLYLLFLYIYFSWLFSEHILYQLIWGKRKKIVCSITLNSFLSWVYICHLSTVSVVKSSSQIFVFFKKQSLDLTGIVNLSQSY